MISTLSHERAARERVRDLAREAAARRLRKAALQQHQGMPWWQRLLRPGLAAERAGKATTPAAKRPVQPSPRSAAWNVRREDV